LAEGIEMKRLHEGVDYQLYKIYVWGGLALLVIYMLVTVLVFDVLDLPDSQAFLLLMVPLVLWFAGILLYWWWVFLFKSNGELEELSRTQRQGVPSIKELKSWSTLHRAMSINGGNLEELVRNEKKSKTPIIVWYGSLNLLALWILGPIFLGSLKIYQLDVGIWIIGVFVWIGAMLVGTPTLLSWGTRSAGKAYLAPLGLAVTKTPGLDVDVLALFGGQKLIPDGPAIVEGKRYGRLVHIETIDKHSLTVVQARTPEFAVHGNDGKLVPDEGSPEEVIQALRSLRKAKRWLGIVVYAGQQGIAIQRQSKGTNMWLYDLWLTEYLLDKTNPGSGIPEPRDNQNE
jgi:hypothetical protein